MPIDAISEGSFAVCDIERGRGSEQSDQFLGEFVQLLASNQTAMFAYAAKLLGDPHEASNVVQEANLAIWKKAKEFEPGTDFRAWASTIVYYQVLANLRDRKRQRLVFDEELVRKLAAFQVPGDVDERRVALRSCVEELRQDQRELIRRRYFQSQSVQSMSGDIGKSPGAVRKSLMRVRRVLLQCIELKSGELS